MIIWIDAQLSPHLAPWITEVFGIEAFSARWLGLRDAEDREIYFKAREADAVIMTKDSDFVSLLSQEGPPPQILWITAGNTSNMHLRGLFKKVLSRALEALDGGESLVEISDAESRSSADQEY